MAVKNFNFKNPKWQTANTLERPFCFIIRYRDFSIFKMTAVHIILLNFVEIGHTVAEISQFFPFF